MTNSAKTIGIFLAFGPDQPIKNQGLGRLMAFMLHGILQRETAQVVIATPAWHKEMILEFLHDENIALDKIELVTTTGIPFLLRIKRALQYFIPTKSRENPRFSHNRHLIKRLHYAAQYGKTQAIRTFFRWLSLSSPFLFISIGLLGLLLTLLLSPLLLLALMGLGAWYGMRALSLLLKKSQALLPDFVIAFINKPLAGLKNYSIAHEAYQALRTQEVYQLITQLNKRTDIKVWYVPSLFWPEIHALRAKKVVAAPDVVFVDFPSQFLDLHDYYHLTYHSITQTIAAADHFICYSDYVKQKHLVEAFYIEPENVSVIAHGVTDMRHHLQQEDTLETTCTTHEMALILLRRYQMSALQQHAYLRDYHLDDMRYLFYSSQIRPYKNFFNLIKAYEIALRERFLNVKLIVTADLYADSVLNDYILSKRLQYDIIALPNVPAQVLAALNQRAVCAINPSLFEGGFPFTFAEAYSVGTPSLMSRIPVVTTEITDNVLQEVMLFDPADIHDMANKMVWAVNNRAALYDLQLALYQQLQQRSWETVAQEYIQLLDQVAAQS